jgi:predicted DNA binding protein/putative methionine-R-sulfoxide reductase with GAF domain
VAASSDGKRVTRSVDGILLLANRFHRNPMTTIAPGEVLAVFERQERPGTPLTAPEVAEVLGCARRTAHEKLTRLAEDGTLATKKVGARGRVWWRPPSRPPAGSDARERAGSSHRPGEDTRAQALRDLHDATRQLMRAESREDVYDVAVVAASRIIGLRLSGLWLYSPDREVLEPVAWTDSGVEEYGEPASFPIDGSLVGRAFREGEYRVYDDITTEEVYDPETRARSELILPLGGYGVLNATSPEVGAYDEVDVSLGRVLAANVQTALRRVDQLAERRARRRELEHQRDELAALNGINVLVEDTVDALVGAATRGEIEETVCEQLATSDVYLGAWIGERMSSEGIAFRTGMGDDGEPIGSVGEAGGEISVPNSVATAIEDNAPAEVQHHQRDELFPPPLRPGSVTSSDLACLAVPLAHADTVFGALVVQKPGSEGFSDRERTALETLGRVVGFVTNAANNRQLLLGNTTVELEIAVRNTETWFLLAAERLDATVSVDGLVPTDDGVIEYVTVEDASTDATPAALLDVPAVTDTRVVTADDTRTYLRCTIRETKADLRALTEYGATLRTARAAEGTATVAARFPAATSPREAMTVLEDAFPTAELISKRVVDVSDRSAAMIGRTVADRLTDKQLAALRAAYLGGYYRSPRDTSAQELADSLDIAPSTLYEHLQAAHRKLLSTVFEEGAYRNTSP